MIEPIDFIHALGTHSVTHFFGVPDSLLKPFCSCILDVVPEENHIIAANEGCAVGLAAGHYLGTGRVPLVYMQNSGIGNSVNPLTSLADSEVYSIPMLLLIGWRGEPGLPDEPQHIRQGRITKSLLDCLGIPCSVLPKDKKKALGTLEESVRLAKEESKPVAILVQKGTFSQYPFPDAYDTEYGELLREGAIEEILKHTPDNSRLVCTTGKASRELYELRERMHAGHIHDFLVVGSMGHASQIALGFAESRSDLMVWCLDGDGSMIMHAGGVVSIGHRQPKNFKHIVLNNAAHESVGGQPTAAWTADLCKLALAAGYRNAWRATNRKILNECMKKMVGTDGPVFLEIAIRRGSQDGLGRPDQHPRDQKEAFMGALEG